VSSRSVLVLLALVALACGGKGSSETSDGGHQGSSGGAGSGSGGGSGDGSGADFGDGSGGGLGDDASAVLDAELNSDSPVVPMYPPPVTCGPPILYGGSSGSGQFASGYEELCSNGHLYMAYCQTPYCECDCTDDGPDGGGVQTHVPTCGGYGFAACGFPTQ